jgi:cobyrinic acid a,c-diamide synthase
MYLFDRVRDGGEKAHHMAGVIGGEVFMTKRLNRFGYVTLTARRNNLLCRKGETINAHEFHYSDATDSGSDFTAEKPQSGRTWECVMADEQRFAGYPHFHFLGNIRYAENFLYKCRQAERTTVNA